MARRSPAQVGDVSTLGWSQPDPPCGGRAGRTRRRTVRRVSEDRATLPGPPGLARVRTRQELAQLWMSRAGPVVIVVLAVFDLRHTLAAADVAHRVAVMVALGVFVVAGVLGLGVRGQPVLAVLAGRWRPGVARPAPAAGPWLPADRPLSRLWLVHVCGLIGLAAASIVLAVLQPGQTGDTGMLLALAASIPLLTLRVSASLAVAAATLVGVSLALHRTPVLSAGLSGLTFISGYVIIRLLMRIRQSNDEAELMQRRAAALAERQRLAREMHDVLAHSLSGLMLQLEGARLLATENPQDPRLPDVIERAHYLGKTGLEEARHAIGMLRDDDLPGPEQLATLAGQFERDSGITCHLTVTGEVRELDSEARLALYRVAQEALTNIRKHARCDRVDIKLDYDDGRTSLTVEDFTPDGAAAASPVSAAASAGGGYGLTGMRERAELLGGSLQAGPTGRGFRVELEVPA
jgi:signal transduction histidine kinase